MAVDRARSALRLGRRAMIEERRAALRRVETARSFIAAGTRRFVRPGSNTRT